MKKNSSIGREQADACSGTQMEFYHQAFGRHDRILTFQGIRIK